MEKLRTGCSGSRATDKTTVARVTTGPSAAVVGICATAVSPWQHSQKSAVMLSKHNAWWETCNSNLATIISYLEFLNSNFAIIVKMVLAELALSSYVLKVLSTLVGLPSTLLVMVTEPTWWHAAMTFTDGRDVDDKDVRTALRCDVP